MPRPTLKRRSPAGSKVRGGFTMIELLMVIVIIGVLVGLLLPAIQGAIRNARRGAVLSEISQLAQALANFKSKYGDYPPSRFLAVEGGNYTAFLTDTTTLHLGTVNDPTSLGTGDITCGQLAQRSVSALRKFWPRVSTTAAPANQWYDFNGNGVQDAPYVMHGHECLVFFLGGVTSSNAPVVLNGAVPTAPVTTANASGVSFGMTGFDKSPTNPFTNNITGNPMYSTNRQPPTFEFNPNRLFVDPNSLTGMPGYYDSLGNPPPLAGGSTLNFYAYFNAYGNNAYDPNDVNVHELDANSNGPIELSYSVAFPVLNSKPPDVSPAPNPYTGTLTIQYNATSNPAGPPSVTYQNPQSFQLLSSGLDGLYGVGGQYVSNLSTSAAVSVPVDLITTPSPYNTTDQTIRQREYDNLTNFKPGQLQ
jgi:prepilin-type N-terminal cleavage/methylation domain-containing protein